MSVEVNVAIVRDYNDQVWNKGKLERLEEFVAKDVKGHAARGFTGTETMKERIDMTRKAFPDLQLTGEDAIAVDGKVVVRWTFEGTHQREYLGIAASGKAISFSGISIFRLAGGKIAEFWIESDSLGLMQQLGVVPAPGE